MSRTVAQPVRVRQLQARNSRANSAASVASGRWRGSLRSALEIRDIAAVSSHYLSQEHVRSMLQRRAAGHPGGWCGDDDGGRLGSGGNRRRPAP